MSSLLSFFSYPDDSLLIYGSFDPALVVLSVLIAAFTSAMALHMASQARQSKVARSRAITLFTGSVAMGGGVWAMHFIGMLAFDLCTPVEYELSLTLVSVVPSVAASGVALKLNSKPNISLRELLVGGVLMGSGIGTMHYTGMAGMVMAPALRYDMGMFALSIVVAVALSVLALWLRTGIGRLPRFRDSRFLGDVVGGIGMGVAISAMHYVGMAAARFVPPPGFELDPDTSPVSLLLATGVSVTTVVIACLVVAVDLLLGYKRLSLEARANEKRIRGILQTAVDGIITINHRGIILAVNDATERMLGWRSDELLGQNIKMLMPEPIRSAHDGYLQNYMETRIARIIGQGRQVEAQHKGGDLIPVRLAIGHVQTANENLFVGFLTDLREQVKMESELKANEARFRSLIGNIPGAAYRCQCNDRWDMVFISDAVEAITGYPATDFMLPHPKRNFADLILEQDRVYAHDLQQNPRAFATEYRITHRDGTVRWLQDNGECVLDEQGSVQFVDGFIMDVTKRKQLDMELVSAKVNAEQAAMSRSAFLANMSHEIRTPMNAIIGFSDILLTTELSREQTEYLSTLSNSARSLLHLLNDILDVAKLEKGKVTLELLDFSMRELIDSVTSTLWIQARKKGLQLEVNLSPELDAYYCGASDRIRQVLTNLVGNAIKFTEQGAVTLDVEPAAKGMVRFRIVDTGIGIEADRLQSIFEPFTQADSSMNRRFGGTGLGTTISRQLVELMGGKLEAESRIREGSCFQFELPLAVATAPPEQQKGQVMELPSLSVLVADDMEQNRDLMRILLEREGHRVTCVTDGSEAVRSAKYNEFDVILMDVQMPNMDGLTASKYIREWRDTHKLARIPVIAMTASVMESDRKAALSAGMDGFCTKPVEFNRLCEEMVRVLQIPVAWREVEEETTESDSAMLDFDKGLALWGSRAAYLDELTKFSHRLERDSVDLHHTLDRGDYATLAQAAHSLLGVSGNLAIATLPPVFSQLEKAAKAKRFQECCNNLSSVSTLSRQLRSELQRLQQSRSASEATTCGNADLADLQSAVGKLIQASERNACDDAALALLVGQSELLGVETIQQLEEAFNNFEFAAALETLHQLHQRVNQDIASS
ncbi:MAG: MHYT domain-containing protein [Pseudomonadota bacterium]|nr:MHYT domain-containing protein [Pseudomonadota bacterium]